MPIEIKELVIKAVVDESKENGKVESVYETTEEQVEEIVSLCVEKVLEILKDKNER